MRAAKFCTDCSLQIFLFEVFDHTVEQYSNLLKTRAFITVTSWLRSRTCLTRLICARLDIQDDVVFRTWSSNVSCGSKTTQRRGLLLSFLFFCSSIYFYPCEYFSRTSYLGVSVILFFPSFSSFLMKMFS